RLASGAEAAGVAAGPALRLAALGAFVEDDAERLAERLRLSNAERALIAAVVPVARALGRDHGEAARRRLVYAVGNERAATAGLLAWADGNAPADEAWAADVAMLATWEAPPFP